MIEGAHWLNIPASRPQSLFKPLNEGRSRNPGDTSGAAGASFTSRAAQRRPESEPRRHPNHRSRRHRSSDAQRRPESEPRRHPEPDEEPEPDEDAQRRPESEPRRHSATATRPMRVVGRSTKAGVGTPATRRRAGGVCRRGTPLNEGRSRNPGDTRRWMLTALSAGTRSTKAGVGTPATRIVRRWAAQRRERSTKAGVGTPATLVGSGHEAIAFAPLNEGRSRNPGDTREIAVDVLNSGPAQRRPESEPRRHLYVFGTKTIEQCAQRRPESEPRRHARGSSAYGGIAHRSTKAGVGTPATHGGIAARGPLRGRSTKAGVGTPATQAASSVPRPTGISAQRRPESEPRRHC